MALLSNEKREIQRLIEEAVGPVRDTLVAIVKAQRWREWGRKQHPGRDPVAGSLLTAIDRLIVRGPDQVREHLLEPSRECESTMPKSTLVGVDIDVECGKPATHTVCTGLSNQWSICDDCLAWHRKNYDYEFDGLEKLPEKQA